MRTLLCITAATGPVPDLGFLNAHGFAVTNLPDNAPDIELALGAHDIVVLACETRGTQYSRIWWYERALFQHVNRGGRLLFCAPSFTLWGMFYSTYSALMPVTPSHRSGLAENYSTRFRWDRSWEKPRHQRVLPSNHPVCAGISDWPEFYEGAKPGSYNAYDFDRWLTKPHSDVALLTENGDVALAFMNFGRGRTGFLLADIHDDAGATWADWADRETFWIALLRHLDREAPVTRAPAGIVPFAPREPLVPRPRFSFQPAPATGRADWADILTRSDWTLLADNQVAVNTSLTTISRDPAAFGDGWYRPPTEEPGIGHVKFYPHPARFESAISADAIVGGQIVELKPEAGGHVWQPHLVTTRFRSADGAIVVERRLAVGDDTVCATLNIKQGRVDAFRLRGFNRYHGFLESVDDHRMLGQVETGVIFGLATSEPVRWKTREAPIRYEGKADLGGRNSLTLVFTAALERADVERRLASALAGPERVFAAAFAMWDHYFQTQVPAFRSDDPLVERMVYGAFLGFRLNLYDIPYQPWSVPHSCPSKMHFDQQWEQDDVQVATIGKWLRDTSLIARQLLRPFKLGFMLNANSAFGLHEGETSGLVGELQQYSVPLRDLYLFSRDPALRRVIIAALIREENENTTHTPVDPATGLLCTFNCLGMDDSPRWDMVSPGKKAEWFQTFERPVLTTDVNATVAHRAAFLAELLAEEGDPRAEEFRAVAAQRKALVKEHLWSDAAGFFVDRVGGEDTFSDVLTPMGFTPLLLGSFGDEIDSRVSRTLHDPAIFDTPYVLPTVACSHPKFDATSYWRGSIWSRTNWYAVEALQAAGLKTDAGELTRRWVALILKNEADMRENFNPLTGVAKCVEMFTEGLAGAADVYLKNVVGFRPTRDGFDLDPIALDASTPSFAFGPFSYRGREITVTWDQTVGQGTLSLDDTTQTWTPGTFRQTAVCSRRPSGHVSLRIKHSIFEIETLDLP